jgi:micrococcal nuclease
MKAKRMLLVIVGVILCLQLVTIAAAKGGAFSGNVKSKVFHSSNCRYYDCGHCTAKFDSREAAIKAGFRPCKVCNP